MALDISVSAVAFPVEEIQQAERAGSMLTLLASPWHLQSCLSSLWRGAGIVPGCRQAPVSVSTVAV